MCVCVVKSGKMPTLALAQSTTFVKVTPNWVEQMSDQILVSQGDTNVPSITVNERPRFKGKGFQYQYFRQTWQGYSPTYAQNT